MTAAALTLGALLGAIAGAAIAYHRGWRAGYLDGTTGTIRLIALGRAARALPPSDEVRDEAERRGI